eukprot:s348_g9.t1
MSASDDRGKLEVDVLHGKVIWWLPNWELQGVSHDECVSRHVDFLDLQLKPRVYPKGCGQFNRPVVLLENVDTAELQVRVSINGWVAFTQHIPRDGHLQREYHSEIKDEDLEIVIELYQVDRQPMRDVLPRLLKFELDKEQKGRKDAEAESDRLRALVHATSNQAANRVCHLTRSALKIQSKWRQVMVQHQLQRDRAETDRRLKQAKFVKAITFLQCLWRLRRKKCERRWLRAQKGCGEAETPYDAILAFDSLAEFLKEGKIDFLQKAESHLEVAKESRYRIVAVVGLFDKGKTWLLNKLFGANLPAGKLCTTRGLSFLWFKERRMLVIDSAGVQSTVSYRAQAVDAIHDAQTTESLMFEMVSRISHQIVFVVNDLTWFEQKYVAMLHQKYVQCKQHKELTVVHNLRNTSDTEEATMLFSRQVMQCYDGELSHLGRLIFTADLGEGVPPVHHIGLCYEFSKAGDAFNAKNREHLLQRLEHGNTLGTTIVLTDLLKSELSRLLPKFVNIEITEPEACGAASGQPISVSFVPAAGADVAGNGYASSGAFCMRLSHEKARVTTKTRGVISPLGEIIAHDVSFDPIVNWSHFESLLWVGKWVCSKVGELQTLHHSMLWLSLNGFGSSQPLDTPSLCKLVPVCSCTVSL